MARAQPGAGAAASCSSSPADAADFDTRVEDGKKQFAGIELPQHTLGVIGLGAIGAWSPRRR